MYCSPTEFPNSPTPLIDSGSPRSARDSETFVSRAEIGRRTTGSAPPNESNLDGFPAVGTVGHLSWKQAHTLDFNIKLTVRGRPGLTPL